MKKTKKLRNSSKQSITVKDNDETSLKKVRSMYIIGNILSLLDEKKRLYMIKYNKKIQNHLELNIEDYKKISGRYIIGERNGKGKEFNAINGKIIFEGNFLNGKKNGEGKEYYDKDKVIFEGNYVNGKREGNGKEYYLNRNLKFEGDYKNGIMWNGIGCNYEGEYEFELKNGKGKVKEYNYDGKLIFEGEYKDGKRNRKGIEYFYDGNIKFKGEYIEGERNGKGKEHFLKGRIKFEGEYLNGKRWNGQGYNRQHHLEFELVEGNGKVKEYFSYNGKLQFEGEYKNGEKNGYGKEYNSAGLIFEGEYLNGKKMVKERNIMEKKY